MSASAASMAHVRHRRNCVDSSLPSSRSVPQPPEPADRPVSGDDIEALPGQLYEPLLQALPQQLEAAHAHTALDELARVSPRQATMVESRFFGGLDVAETAEALGISEATVLRDWRTAKAWLARELRKTTAQ